MVFKLLFLFYLQAEELVNRSRAGLWEVCTVKIINHLADDEEKEDMGCEDYQPLEGVDNWSGKDLVEIFF